MGTEKSLATQNTKKERNIWPPVFYSYAQRGAAAPCNPPQGPTHYVGPVGLLGPVGQLGPIGQLGPQNIVKKMRINKI